MRGACAPRRFSAQARCRNLASERASNHLFTHAKHAQLSDSRGLVGQLWTAGTPVAKERVSRMQAVRSSATRSATSAMQSASGVLLLTLDLDRGCLRFRTRFSDVCQGWPAVTQRPAGSFFPDREIRFAASPAGESGSKKRPVEAPSLRPAALHSFACWSGELCRSPLITR